MNPTREEEDTIVRETKERCLERFAKPYRERLEWQRECLRMAEEYREKYIKYNIEEGLVRWIEGEIEKARKDIEVTEKEIETLKVMILE